MFSLESPHRRNSSEYTQYTIFNIKEKNHPKFSKICSYGIFPRDSRRVLNSRGEQAISVRAIDVPLYHVDNSKAKIRRLMVCLLVRWLIYEPPCHNLGSLESQLFLFLMLTQTIVFC